MLLSWYHRRTEVGKSSYSRDLTVIDLQIAPEVNLIGRYQMGILFCC